MDVPPDFPSYQIGAGSPGAKEKLSVHKSIVDEVIEVTYCQVDQQLGHSGSRQETRESRSASLNGEDGA